MERVVTSPWIRACFWNDFKTLAKRHMRSHLSSLSIYTMYNDDGMKRFHCHTIPIQIQWRI